jgi:hypothetical protein
MAKLRRQVRRTKEILSANSDAPFNVEELHEGRDFSSSISRADFEAMAEKVWGREGARLGRGPAGVLLLGAARHGAWPGVADLAGPGRATWCQAAGRAAARGQLPDLAALSIARTPHPLPDPLHPPPRTHTSSVPSLSPASGSALLRR